MKLKASSFFILGLALLAISCKQEEKPKVIYKPDSEETKVELVEKAKEGERTDDIRIADLPIVMGDSNYLIHPIGQVRVYNYNSKYGSNKSSHFSYTVSNYVPFEITGYLENLMFQHKDSLDIRPLTNLKMQIQSVSYLKSIADKTKKHILVYNVFDSDTNRDGKIDNSDIKTLYISDINGTKFKKVTSDLHELLDWTVIDVQNRLYFRTIEDINKNGAFDKDDNVNYYYINLLDKQWEVINYNPMQIRNEIEFIEENEKEDTPN